MLNPRIVLRTNNHLGDVVILTGVVANIKANYPEVDIKVDANPNYLQIFDGNPNISDFDIADAGAVLNCTYAPFSQRSADGGTHIEGFTKSILNQLSEFLRKPNKNIIIKRSADIFIPVTENIHGDYCVINANCQTCSEVKGYPYWQQVIDMCPGIRFIQIGGSEDRDISQALNGVLDLRGKTAVKQLVSLVANSKCVVSSSSAVVHIGSAFPKVTSVVLTGAREPAKMTEYQNSEHLTSRCCYGFDENNGCMKFKTSVAGPKRCLDCRKIAGRWYAQCMCSISPEAVAKRIRRCFNS